MSQLWHSSEIHLAEPKRRSSRQTAGCLQVPLLAPRFYGFGFNNDNSIPEQAKHLVTPDDADHKVIKEKQPDFVASEGCSWSYLGRVMACLFPFDMLSIFREVTDS